MLCFPKPLLGPNAFGASEFVHVLSVAFSPRSDNSVCIPNPSAAPVTTVENCGCDVLNAGVACVLFQSFTTVPLIGITPPLVDFFSMSCPQSESTSTSTFNPKLSRAHVFHVTCHYLPALSTSLQGPGHLVRVSGAASCTSDVFSFTTTFKRCVCNLCGSSKLRQRSANSNIHKAFLMEDVTPDRCPRGLQQRQRCLQPRANLQKKKDTICSTSISTTTLM